MKKKIVIAPDKFKGSLSGLEFCNIVERELNKHVKHIDVIKCPLADGGDGTIEVLNYFLKGSLIEQVVNNPLFRPIKAAYLLSSDKQTAYIEMSAASGIRLLCKEELNPLNTTTYGTGELILDAIEKGARHILLGIGGSATNDGGLGMAKALGYRLYDIDNNVLIGTGVDLEKLNYIDDSNVHPLINNVCFEVASDVDNPLFGVFGAAYIYAPQKGADQDMVIQLDKGLQNYHSVTKQYKGIDVQNVKGAGAAGGLGAGCITFLDAKLKSGIELIKDVAEFDAKVQGADWIITGEGKLDHQTLSGKVIKGVMDGITKQKLAIFCGINELCSEDIDNSGIDYINEAIHYANNINDSIDNASNYLELMVEDFAKKHLI